MRVSLHLSLARHPFCVLSCDLASLLIRSSDDFMTIIWASVRVHGQNRHFSYRPAALAITRYRSSSLIVAVTREATASGLDENESTQIRAVIMSSVALRSSTQQIKYSFLVFHMTRWPFRVSAAICRFHVHSPQPFVFTF